VILQICSCRAGPGTAQDTVPCRAARWAEISGTAQPALRAVPARPNCFRAGPGFRAQVFGPCSCQPIKHGPDLQLYLALLHASDVVGVQKREQEKTKQKETTVGFESRPMGAVARWACGKCGGGGAGGWVEAPDPSDSSP